MNYFFSISQKFSIFGTLKIFDFYCEHKIYKEIILLINMPRGRPLSSQIRQNVVEILYFLGKAHGYGVYKVYREVFPKATMRSIYYHLKKGLQTEEFKIEKIQMEKGNYSWGSEAEKTYYALGKKASPKIDQKVKKYLDKLSQKTK